MYNMLTVLIDSQMPPSHICQHEQHKGLQEYIEGHKTFSFTIKPLEMRKGESKTKRGRGARPKVERKMAPEEPERERGKGGQEG